MKLLLLFSLALTTNVETVVTKLEKFYRQTQTLEARFEQSFRSDRFGEKKASGNLALAKPGKMRWDYDTPKGRVFVSNGKKLTLYDPEERQALMTTQPKEENLPVALLFLWGKGDLRKTFDLSIQKSTEGTVTLRGTPKQPIPNVKEVELRVRTDSKFYVESTIIRDLLGGETEWKFSNVKTNGAVSAKTFEFTPPDGTTIVPIATDKLKMQ